MSKKALAKVEDSYLEYPLIEIVQSLLDGIFPGLGGIIIGGFKRLQERKIKLFFEELRKGNIALTEEIIKSNSFINRVVTTLRAVNRERREEKIRYFARLLKNFPIEPENEDLNDEYEILLDTLEDLTFRELYILVKLHGYETKFREAQEDSELKKVNLYWEDFRKEVCKTLALSESEFSAYIARLNRTGLFKEFTGTYWGYEGKKGRLTDLFYKLVENIEAREEDF